MSVKMLKGWKENGLQVGKRDLRDPAKLEDFNLLDSFKITFAFILATLYSIYLDLKTLLGKLFWTTPISLKGKVCLVTGSGRGLGRDLCLEFARQGAKVVCTDINDETNGITVKMAQELGATAKKYKLNVANRKEVMEVADKVEKELGPVYLVVNNAAIVMPPSEATEDFVRASYNVNILGAIWVMNAFLPKMKARNCGHIVNIASIGAFTPIPHMETYSSTKAALRNYTISMAMKLKMEKSDVKVTCVNPHFINTSADYIDMIGAVRVNRVSTKMVVEKVMEAIKYGLEDVSVPTLTKIGILCQYISSPAMAMFWGMFNATAIIPDKKEYEDLPAGRIVRACSGDIDESIVKM